MRRRGALRRLGLRHQGAQTAFKQLKRGNVLYEVSVKSDKATLVDMANQMILTGAR